MTLVNQTTLSKTRNALPGWDVKPSPDSPEMMRCFRPVGLGGVTFDAPSVEVAKRAARTAGELG